MSTQDTLQYYETPEWLVDKAWALFKNRHFDRVLDVCAGTGSMADGFGRLYGDRWSNRHKPPVDCIEINLEHHPTLREKGYTVVALDFETFEGGSIYSHIVTNPPFARGAAYVLRAWDSLWDGEIAAILNAETLRNPCTRERQRLVKLVREHGSAEFFADAFKGNDVRRQADVEVALVYLRKPAECGEDWIGPVIDGLRIDAPPESDFKMPQELALPNDFVDNQVVAFRLAVKAMREAVRAQAVADIMRARIGKTMADMVNNSEGETGSVVAVGIEGVRGELRRRYEDLKDRAWASVLRSTETLSRLSQKVQKQAESRFEEIKKLEFTSANVWGFLLGLVQSQPQLQLDMMCDVFDTISRYHTDNAVLYRGWKSNDRHREAGMRIRMTRFILPGHGTESWCSSPRWETTQLLSDFDKVFSMLDGGQQPPLPLASVFTQHFAALKAGDRVTSSYFDVRYYRQAGTIHFYPKRRDLIDRLNRWVGQHRRWLPPEGLRGADKFWQAYEAAEAMDKEVRTEIARRTPRGVHCDPVRDAAWQDDGEGRRARGHALLIAAIESVLAKRGLLDALEAEEAMNGLPPAEQLRLAA